MGAPQNTWAELIVPGYRVYTSEEHVCSHCGEGKQAHEFYQRKADTGSVRPNGQRQHREGQLVQPCKACRKIYAAKQRRLKNGKY